MQTINKLDRFGVPSGMIMSGDEWDSSHLVNVASIQTLHAWAVRRRKINMPRADLVIVDETHALSGSSSWRDILNNYPEAIILGLTATPITQTGMGLGHYFDAMVKCPSIPQSIKDGYVVPIRYFCPSAIDLNGLRIVAGDYAEKELEQRMNVPKLVGDIVENWAKYGENRQTMVFASGVKHSIRLAEEFNRIGVVAEHVDGHTPKPERDEINKRFASRDVRVLCSCGVYCEGTDNPEAACLVFARPTKSLRRYIQIIGRVMRTYPGKQNAILLDHAGAVYEHGPIEQDWDWQLEYHGKENATKTTRKKIGEPKEITCEKCKAIFFGKIVCPECHTRVKINGKEIPTYDAWLVAMDAIENPKTDKQEFYRMIMGYALERGKKPAMAYYKYLDKFKEEAPWSWKNLAPMSPNKEVLAHMDKERKKFFWSRKNPELAQRLGYGGTR